MLKNILVPIDGSEGSDRAVAEAIKLAEVCEAKLNFLYIANINQLAINACLSDVVLEAVTKAGNVILDRAMQMVPSGIKKEAFSETGSPAVAILSIATMIFAPIGVKTAHKLPARQLKISFGIMLLLIAVKMVWNLMR